MLYFLLALACLAMGHWLGGRKWKPAYQSVKNRLDELNHRFQIQPRMDGLWLTVDGEVNWYPVEQERGGGVLIHGKGSHRPQPYLGGKQLPVRQV